MIILNRQCDLIAALFGNNGLNKIAIAGNVGWLQSVQREDGSGNSFNITLIDEETKQSVTVYKRFAF